VDGFFVVSGFLIVGSWLSDPRLCEYAAARLHLLPRYRRHADGVPTPGVWDRPLWTLIFELLCYIGVAALGILGLLRRQWTILAVFVVAVAGSAMVGYPITTAGAIHLVLRFIVVFSAGTLVYQFRDRIPA
jgi:peptidoglycan/LPS O-acetylase OafA/YrhL